MTRRVVIAGWLGFSLAALFFYPLAAALQTDIFYLQWQPSDALETASALAGLALLAGAVVYATWPRSDRTATLALLALAAMPLASFVAGVSRQVPFDDELREAWANPLLRLGTPAAVLIALAAAFAFVPTAFHRWLRRVIILTSPVSLVVAGTLAASAASRAPVVSVDGTPSAQRLEPSAERRAPIACDSVVAWLFDELSFSYLYQDDGRIGPEFPAIRQFAESATNYLSVTAPARETLVAMPSLLAARHVRDVRIARDGLVEVADEGPGPYSATTADGLFGTARRLGFRTEMAGYYLPYCHLLGGLVDACQSFSFYNVSTTRSRFSLTAPLGTTLILWPRQFPFGLLKSPPYAALQQALVERAEAFARRPLTGPGPVFRFVHFSVPHFPFAFDADGYDPPVDALRTEPDANYVRQLRFVDTLFGRLVEDMKQLRTYDTTTIVLLADHGFRFGGRERDPLHIPFVVKRPGQVSREVVTARLAGEQLLKRTVEDSCRPL
jgi:hypothetical protein